MRGISNLFHSAVTSGAPETHAQYLERTAFDLGMGDQSQLESAGLMAKTNGAVLAGDDETAGPRKRRETLLEFMQRQIMIKRNEISAQMDELDAKIRAEGEIIAQNNTDIHFIRSLNEDDIMGADGRPSQKVQDFLKKHGIENPEELDLAETMLILQRIETDLHEDNADRMDQIERYEDRFARLQRRADRLLRRNDNIASPEDRRALEETIARQPYEVNFQAMTRTENEVVREDIEELRYEEMRFSESDGFSFPSP